MMKGRVMSSNKYANKQFSNISNIKSQKSNLKCFSGKNRPKSSF